MMWKELILSSSWAQQFGGGEGGGGDKLAISVPPPPPPPPFYPKTVGCCQLISGHQDITTTILIIIHSPIKWSCYKAPDFTLAFIRSTPFHAVMWKIMWHLPFLLWVILHTVNTNPNSLKKRMIIVDFSYLKGEKLQRMKRASNRP